MSKGRRKTIEQHKLEGTYREDRHANLGFTADAIESTYSPPSRMHDRAKRIWVQLLPIVQKGQVFETDLLAFEVLCNSMADYLHCVKTIVADGYKTTHTNKAGETNMVRHYLSTDKKQAYDMIQAMLAKFGLTPADRAKVYMAVEAEEADELDGLV